MTDFFHKARRRIRRVRNYRRIEKAVRGKRGLEIGGPSTVFSPADPSSYIPAIYALAGSIDNCNFAATTTWSHGEAGRTFHYLSSAEPGLQYIHDATDLTSIASQTYDFLLASHILEHVANPLRALEEFHRVLKPHGSLLVMVPNREYTFDHRRPLTTFAHLQQDRSANMEETDMTHLEEVLTLHDFDIHNAGGSLEQFRERSLRNAENRCMHHHVFSPEVMEQAVRQAAFRPLYVSAAWPPHIIVFARCR